MKYKMEILLKDVACFTSISGCSKLLERVIMNIENDVFKRYQVDINKLEPYGFIKENDIYTYSKVFMDNSFKAVITINSNNIIGKVIDLDNNLEYTNIRIDNTFLSYVNKVKNKYIDILKDIRDNCFKKKYFIYDQTNRINDYIVSIYNDNPEFLWKKYDGDAIYRNKHNNKWFAIIMNIDRSSISNTTGEVEIINVKVDSNIIDDLLKKEGLYKAYHMNKKHWITIILDDTLKDEEIIKLIDKSYELVNKK